MSVADGDKGKEGRKEAGKMRCLPWMASDVIRGRPRC